MNAPQDHDEETTEAPESDGETMRGAWLPPAVVAAWPNLSRAARSLLVPIATTLGWRHRAHLSYEDLKIRSGLRSPTSVAAAIKELQAAGLIKRIRRWRLSAVYWWYPEVVPADGPPAEMTHTDGGGADV